MLFYRFIQWKVSTNTLLSINVLWIRNFLSYVIFFKDINISYMGENLHMHQEKNFSFGKFTLHGLEPQYLEV
jgi:hypothetical protein